MSHSSLLRNGHGEKKSNEVNFCELFSRILFGTFIGRFYLCTLFVLFEDIRIQFNYPYVQ
jgi:hypothetical protein